MADDAERVIARVGEAGADVYLDPGVHDGRLGVHDETVEIENEGADHRVARVVGRPSMLTAFFSVR